MPKILTNENSVFWGINSYYWNHYSTIWSLILQIEIYEVLNTCLAKKTWKKWIKGSLFVSNFRTPFDVAVNAFPSHLYFTIYSNSNNFVWIRARILF